MERILEDLRKLAILSMAEVPEHAWSGILALTRDSKITPSGAVNAVQSGMRASNLTPTELVRARQAVRWFTIIRRDYGAQAIEQTITELLGKGRKKKWCLASGEEVVDRLDSHLHAEVLELLPEIFSAISSCGRDFIVHEHRFSRIVGKTSCVETWPGDKILYARRPGRDGLSRFVENRKPVDCSRAFVVLLRLDDGRFEIRTAFIGRQGEHEPWDKHADPVRSRAFWSRHALVWGSEPIISGTETIRCPW